MAEDPPSTLERSIKWKTWHYYNYFFGGITFFFGSMLLFPSFMDLLNAIKVSAWLYTLGSFTFLLADITEWLHYFSKKCLYPVNFINFLVSAFGSLLYLIGSACFIPEVNAASTGQLMFQLGSSAIVISQTWKLIRFLLQPGKSCSQIINEDENGFYVDLAANIGGLMYLIGTLILQKSAQQPSLYLPAVTFYCFGGLFFFTSGLFMRKRYFLDAKKNYEVNVTSNEI